ncbi:MAG: hypothetical protein M3P18_09905 [Actinomycetota bacterium]|nr:hypothetical protein [Actinomycetota bacterium]
MKSDPKRLFRDAERFAAPDLWEEAERRASAPAQDPMPPTRHRLVAALVALAICLPAGVFAVQALSPGHQPISGAEAPAPTAPTVTATIPFKGSHATTLTSGDGAAWASVSEGLYRIEGSTNEVTKLPQAQGPFALTYSGGSLWTAGWVPGPGEVVQRVDPDTGIPSKTFDLGAKWIPGDVVAQAGSVWVSVAARGDSNDFGLVQIDPATDQMSEPVDLSSSLPSDLKHPFLVNLAEGDGFLWLIVWDIQGESVHGGYLLRFDPSSQSIDGAVSIGQSGLLTVGYGAVWTNDASGHDYIPVRIDAQSLSIQHVEVDQFMPFATGDDRVWFLTDDGHTQEVAGLDPQTLGQTTGVAVGTASDGAFMVGGNGTSPGMSFDPSTRTMWLLREDSTVVRIDLADPEPPLHRSSFASPAQPYVAPPPDARGRCVPPEGDSNTLTSVSLSEGNPGTSIKVSGPVPHVMEDGSYDAKPTTYQVWWNVDETNWTDVAGDASSLAAGESPKDELPDGAQMLALERVTDDCSFAIDFEVPDLPAGTYPVTILDASPGGATNRATFSFTVDAS